MVALFALTVTAAPASTTHGPAHGPGPSHGRYHNASHGYTHGNGPYHNRYYANGQWWYYPGAYVAPGAVVAVPGFSISIGF